jgi:hypothetical protein
MPGRTGDVCGINVDSARDGADAHPSARAQVACRLALALALLMARVSGKPKMSRLRL